MKILIACEFSGVVNQAFTDRGHDVISCDLLPTEKPHLKHYQGDINNILNEKWDLMVAHPPCTYLSNSGVCWLYRDKDRWIKMIEGANFFKKLLDTDIPRIAIENPIMHKYAIEIIGRRQDQVIQPYMFGHPEKKATCLWLKGLSILKETNNVKEEMLKLPDNERQRIHYLSPSKTRWKERSRTLIGIAQAMADQWGIIK